MPDLIGQDIYKDRIREDVFLTYHRGWPYSQPTGC